MTVQTYQMECKKHGLRQTQDGVTVTFVLHPNDVPGSLLTDPMGQRYMLVLAPIGDDEQPLPVKKEKRDWKELSPVEQAGILANDPHFLRYTDLNTIHGQTLGNTAQYIRTYCGITSRKELEWNTEAQKKFKDLVCRFMDWKERAA